MDELLEQICATPIAFGLEAQGKIPLIHAMLAEGKSWNEIGEAIGWEPKAAHDHYVRYMTAAT